MNPPSKSYLESQHVYSIIISVIEALRSYFTFISHLRIMVMVWTDFGKTSCLCVSERAMNNYTVTSATNYRLLIIIQATQAGHEDSTKEKQNSYSIISSQCLWKFSNESCMLGGTLLCFHNLFSIGVTGV